MWKDRREKEKTRVFIFGFPSAYVVRIDTITILDSRMLAPFFGSSNGSKRWPCIATGVALVVMEVGMLGCWGVFSKLLLASDAAV